MTITEVCDEITRRRTEAVNRRIEPHPKNNPTASDLSTCAREMTLAMTHWRERPLPSVELKERFERGNLIEDAVLTELGSIGVRVRVERRPFEIKDKQGRVILRGKLDGFVEFGRETFPMEVKSLDPNVFRRIDQAADFDRFPWARKWPRQLMSYLYAENQEAGFFLLDNCLGAWKLIPVALDLEEMEAILQRCEAAVEHRDAGTLPDFITDTATCRRCWAAGRVCFPPGLGGDGYQVLDDGELEAKLKRREELDAAATEWDALDRDVKATVKGRAAVLVGEFLITGQQVERHLKEQPARISKFWQSKIERISPRVDTSER